jgi:hypothetical protein
VNAIAGTQPRLFRRITDRTWAFVLAAWGALIGILPHVLHHVGPLAGAALLAGAAGRLLFGTIAVVVSVPLMLRVHRRFETWLAPAIALTAMAAAFALSTFLVAPLITGSERGPAQPGVQQPAGHMGHHPASSSSYQS